MGNMINENINKKLGSDLTENDALVSEIPVYDEETTVDTEYEEVVSDEAEYDEVAEDEDENEESEDEDEESEDKDEESEDEIEEDLTEEVASEEVLEVALADDDATEDTAKTEEYILADYTDSEMSGLTEEQRKRREIIDKITTGILIFLLSSPVLIILYIFLWFVFR